MCIFPHPDDETLGAGPLLAKYAAEGVETTVICATAGQRGWPTDRPGYPGPEGLGRIRAEELRAACSILGVHEVVLLDYMDGDLDQADPDQIIGELVYHLRRVRPQVVVTFGPDGGYGHPDHIAISQFTQAAAVCAADSSYTISGALTPHRLAKLYYMVDSKTAVEAFRELFHDDIAMEIDGEMRRMVGWEDWMITTRIDGAAYWEQIWQAILCHATQVREIVDALAAIPAEQHHRLLGIPTLYRAYSLVNGGRQVETDLFAGIVHSKEAI
jgi:LmbE family N-acetylglucosaminyl deacetylase